jgi:hypothetical protein
VVFSPMRGQESFFRGGNKSFRKGLQPFVIYRWYGNRQRKSNGSCTHGRSVREDC